MIGYLSTERPLTSQLSCSTVAPSEGLVRVCKRFVKSSVRANCNGECFNHRELNVIKQTRIRP